VWLASSAAKRRMLRAAQFFDVYSCSRARLGAISVLFGDQLRVSVFFLGICFILTNAKLNYAVTYLLLIILIISKVICAPLDLDQG